MNMADAAFALTNDLRDDKADMGDSEQLLIRGLLQTWITKDKMDTEQPFLVDTIVNFAKKFSEACEDEGAPDNAIYKQYPEPESW